MRNLLATRIRQMPHDLQSPAAVSLGPTLTGACVAVIAPQIFEARPVRRQRTFSHVRAKLFAWVLRLTVASLLIGHGGIGAFMQHQAWTVYFTVLGIVCNYFRLRRHRLTATAYRS